MSRHGGLPGGRFGFGDWPARRTARDEHAQWRIGIPCRYDRQRRLGHLGGRQPDDLRGIAGRVGRPGGQVGGEPWIEGSRLDLQPRAVVAAAEGERDLCAWLEAREAAGEIGDAVELRLFITDRCGILQRKRLDHVADLHARAVRRPLWQQPLDGHASGLRVGGLRVGSVCHRRGRDESQHRLPPRGHGCHERGLERVRL